MVKRLILAGVASLVCLLCVEGLIRVACLNPRIERYLFPVMIGWGRADYLELHAFSDELQKWLLRPVDGFRHVHDGGEYDYLIHTSPYAGFYVRQKNLPVSQDSWHFGDSMVFGFGLDEELTAVSLLNGHESEHVNLAVPGDNVLSMLDQAISMASVIKEEAMPGRMYFHVFLGNDIAEGLRMLQDNHDDSSAHATKEHGRRISCWTHIKDRSRLAKLLADRISVKKPSGFSRDMLFVPSHLEYIRSGVGADRQRSEGIQDFVDALGLRAVLLRKLFGGQIVFSYIPPKELMTVDACVDDGWQTLLGRFQAATADLGIVHLDLFGTAERSRLPEYFFKKDTHLNHRGHSFYARKLIERSYP